MPEKQEELTTAQQRERAVWCPWCGQPSGSPCVAGDSRRKLPRAHKMRRDRAFQEAASGGRSAQEQGTHAVPQTTDGKQEEH